MASVQKALRLYQHKTKLLAKLITVNKDIHLYMFSKRPAVKAVLFGFLR